MMVYPYRDSAIRTRKPSSYFRKSQSTPWAVTPEPPPWYTWESKHTRSRSEMEIYSPMDNGYPKLWATVQSSQTMERPSRYHDPHKCDCINAKRDLRDYLLTSTLHGLRYIGEAKLTWLERFFWLAAVLSSLVCAAFFIMNIYDKWLKTPMIVSINPENMPLTGLPFPAVTICNVNQAKKSVAGRIKKTGNSLDKKLLFSLCASENDTLFLNSSDADNADWSYLKGFLINVTQPCAEMLAACYWRSESRDCEKLFNAQLTDEGLCCTFNVVHREMMYRNAKTVTDLNLTFPFPPVDWTPEGGYPEHAPVDAFPWRPIGVGTSQGLTLVLDANIAEYYCATTSSPGFKILLHSPIESPKITDYGEMYAAGTEARVAVIPRVVDAQPQIRSIAVNKRLCVFSSELALVFFRTYTQKNCEMECEARRMLKECGCVQYYMPKNRTTHICGKADMKCIFDLQATMDNKLVDEEDDCSSNCLPGCMEISYSERVSSATLSETLLKQSIYLNDQTPEYFKNNMLVIHFYFEDTSFIRYTKGEIFGLTEFIANTGGLLGLCMGFSVMSLVELIYFLSLRAVCLARTRRPPNQFTK